jgi:hypothetical protein
VSLPRLVNERVALDLPPVEALDQLDARALVSVAERAAALHAGAQARLALLGTAPASAPPTDELLTARAAAPLLDMSEDWVRRNGEREGLAVRVGARAIRYSRRKIAQYVQRRAGRPG